VATLLCCFAFRALCCWVDDFVAASANNLSLIGLVPTTVCWSISWARGFGGDTIGLSGWSLPLLNYVRFLLALCCGVLGTPYVLQIQILMIVKCWGWHRYEG